MSVGKIKKKILTFLRLLVTLDISGLKERRKILWDKYGDRAVIAKTRFLNRAMSNLDEFLFVGSRLTLDTVEDAEVTIVLVLWNKAELTYQCLQSLTYLNAKDIKFSVLIIDNASSDMTQTLMTRIAGATIIRNTDNVGFLKACNQARDLVTSPLLLLLNNDTIVHQGAVEAAVRTIKESDKYGAVGGRIVLPHSVLQEAGNIVWNDGTCVGYCRGKPEYHYEAMFKRPVDYCSGAFLLTRTDLFKKMGGFDERYLPAYYEETDYCINLWKSGYQVIYEPRAAITHFEFGSAALSGSAFALMTKNRLKLVEKHADYLKGKDPPPIPGTALFPSRVPKEFRNKKHILYIEDRVPNKVLGAGFPRSNETVRILETLGYEVTVFPFEGAQFAWNDNYRDISHDTELVNGIGCTYFLDFLNERPNYYDLFWVCRPNNLEYIKNEKNKGNIPRNIPVIYDGEAIFSDREAALFALTGKYSASKWKVEKEEFDNASAADIVVAVSESDAARLRTGTGRPVHVIGHDFHMNFSDRSFAERTDIVFIGSFHGTGSPNGDSIKWFLEEVFPLIKAKLGATIRLKIVGYNPISEWDIFKKFANDIVLTGRVEDLSAEFAKARFVIIPTRFAAGIPQKAFDAAEHGVPCVVTDLIARQMGWEHGKHALVSKVNDAESFANQCIQLYTDEVKWKEIQRHLKVFMETGAATYNTRSAVNACVDAAFALKGGT